MNNSIGRKSKVAAGLVAIGMLSAVTFTVLHYLDVLKIPTKAFPGLVFGAFVFTLLASALLITNMNSINKNTQDIDCRLNNVESIESIKKEPSKE